MKETTLKTAAQMDV